MAVQDAGGGEEEEKALYLAKCVQRSSLVSHAAGGHIRSPLTLDVVFAKETALELVVLAEDGSVQSVCEQPVFGSIKDMKILRWNESQRAPDPQTYGKDLLVLLSDSGKLSFLTFSVEFHRFLAISQVHLGHPGVSLRELGWLLAVESRSRAVCVSAFEDHLAVYPTSIAAGANVVEKGIKYPLESGANTSARVGTSGCTIWSTTFVTPGLEQDQEALLLAVLLHRRGAMLNEVHILSIDPNDRSLQLCARYSPSGDIFDAFLAVSIDQVPACPGSLLLFKAGGIMVVDSGSPSSPYVTDVVPSVLLSFTGRPLAPNEDTILEDEAGSTSLPLVSAWCWEPEGSRLAFSLDSGDIYIARLHQISGKPSLALRSHHRCPPCKVILWTQGGFITAMVDMGDGQVLKIDESDQLIPQSTIQNIAPILDFSLADYYGEKQDQMFACCGGGSEGSIRIIRNGNSVEKLICTPPVYQGVSGIWTLRLLFSDPFHAFFVISFVEETRVLSVGLNFVDITDAVGFNSETNTLACGLIEDAWLAQVSSSEVRLCHPSTRGDHQAPGVEPGPLCTSWRHQGFCISVGAVSRGKVILALSRPGLLLLLGTRRTPAGLLELEELQYCLLEAEISCISIPQQDVSTPLPPSVVGLHRGDAVPPGVDLGNVCVVGTHKPSVELLSTVPGEKFAPLAIGHVSLLSSTGASMTGCVPQDVRLAMFDRLYVLTGLRNGMLLRYEWPETSMNSASSSSSSSLQGSLGERPVQLYVIAVRRVGVSPVCLIPLEPSLRSDIIALSDRPWFLQIAHSQRISYTSISFQPSTYVTPVCSQDCPNGFIFLADCSLHLVEMEQSRTLNVQKLHLGSTPRRILYHPESKTLLVLQSAEGAPSELSCLDPLSGASHCRYTFGHGEVAKCLQFMRFGAGHLLLVGTSSTYQRPIMSTGEAEGTLKGHLMIIRLEQKSKKLGPGPCSEASSALNEDPALFSEAEEWDLISKAVVGLPGPVLAVAPYLGQYVIASAGNNLFCLGFSSEGVLRLKKLTSVKTRFLITNIAVHFTTIAVGDCRDGLLLYTYREDTKKLEQLQCDPMKRLIADCALVDIDAAVVMDRQGNFCALSTAESAEENGSPERNLTLDCWFHVGEISLSIRKGSFAYKASVEDTSRVDRLMHSMGSSCIVASTLLGSVFIFIRVTREEYKLLEAVQARLSVYPLTAPVLGNNHARFRGQGSPVSVSLFFFFLFFLWVLVSGSFLDQASVNKALDGDMLAQFLDLTNAEQLAVLKEPVTCSMNNKDWMHEEHLSIEQVMRLLERIHHTLT